MNFIPSWRQNEEKNTSRRFSKTPEKPRTTDAWSSNSNKRKHCRRSLFLRCSLELRETQRTPKSMAVAIGGRMKVGDMVVERRLRAQPFHRQLSIVVDLSESPYAATTRKVKVQNIRTGGIYWLRWCDVERL